MSRLGRQITKDIHSAITTSNTAFLVHCLSRTAGFWFEFKERGIQLMHYQMELNMYKPEELSNPIISQTNAMAVLHFIDCPDSTLLVSRCLTNHRVILPSNSYTNIVVALCRTGNLNGLIEFINTRLVDLSSILSNHGSLILRSTIDSKKDPQFKVVEYLFHNGAFPTMIDEKIYQIVKNEIYCRYEEDDLTPEELPSFFGQSLEDDFLE